MKKPFEYYDRKSSFVLGNGISRKSISIPNLKKSGKVYACNAVYRTDNPDFLVAVDTRMIIEINKSGYQHKNSVWTNPRKGVEALEGFNFFNPSKGWSSGPTALWLASQHDVNRIYILGFDFKGVNQGTAINNLYAGTKNYKSEDSKATFFGNWLRQTSAVIKEHSHIEYIRVIQQNDYCPEELDKFSNFKTIDINKFCKHLPYDPLCQNDSF